MRKVLAIIAAVMFAAIVLSPVMGYTIQSGANQTYSIQSTPVNYSISMGAPAHNITPGMIPSEVSPASAVTVTNVPYSIKLGAAAPYSVKLASGATATPEGMQTTPGTIALGSLAKNAASTTQAAPVTQAPTTTQAPSTAAPQNVSPPAPQAATQNGSLPEEVPASAEPKEFSIMGRVFDNTSNAGLAGWMVNLEQPAGTVIANTTTNNDGNYAFNNKYSGMYVVSEVLPMGWAIVTPADGKYTVNLTDKDITGINFANKEMPAGNVTLPSNATSAVPPAVTPAANATQLNSTLPK